METELIQLVIVNIPNFVGFAAGLFALYRLNVKILDQNERLQQAMIELLKDAEPEAIKRAMNAVQGRP